MGKITILHKPEFSLDDIIFEPTITALWVEFVKFGEKRSFQTLGEDLESYLVFTLMRFMERTNLFSIVVATEFLKASVEYTGREKERVLSEVGDISLILGGLFPERQKAMGISKGYLGEMGSTAFFELAFSLKRKKYLGMARFYNKVSKAFPVMTEVLLATREEKLPGSFNMSS